MPTRRRKNTWTKWLISLFLLTTVVVAVVLLVRNSIWNDGGEKDNGPDTVLDEKDEKKEETKTEDKKEDIKEPEQKAPQYDGESPNKSEVLTGMITYANVENDRLAIRANIDQFLQSGNCTLKIYKDETLYYSQSAKIVESVTTSACDGFEIQVDELPNGELLMVISLDSDGKNGKIEGRVNV